MSHATCHESGKFVIGVSGARDDVPLIDPSAIVEYEACFVIAVADGDATFVAESDVGTA